LPIETRKDIQRTETTKAIMKNTSTLTSTPAQTPVAAAANPSASMTNTKRCAKRTELLLKIPGVKCASDLLLEQQQQDVQGQACTRDFTHLVPQPEKDEEQKIQDLVLRTSTQIQDPALRHFMASVLGDLSIYIAITIKTYPGQRYPIELIRRASRIALNSGYLPREQGDVLHVAVILAGVRESLIQNCPELGGMASELLYDFIRDALKKLQKTQPQMEYMLRLVFDWGGDEEGETEYVQWLKRAIGMAMAAVGMSGTDKGTAHKHNN
jgi:hypothetical protein